MSVAAGQVQETGDPSLSVQQDTAKPEILGGSVGDHAPSRNDDEDSGEDEGSDESESEDDEPSMVVARSRRSNAGRNLSKLIAQHGAEEDEQDETMQEIFQEVAGDDEFSDEVADDAGDFNMDSSSSDDEDGNEEEDKGEQELQKAERARRPKKRKTMQQLYRPRPPKHPRIAPSASTANISQSAEVIAKSRKKSERVSWVPTADEGPTRASKRTLAVENKARVHERLKEKEELRLRTFAVMQAADRLKEARKPKALTQEEHLAEAARIEAENHNSLNRWVENERIREAERKEKLAALKNRTIEGPFVRMWSGQSIWAGHKLEHVGKGGNIVEIENEVNQRKEAAYQKQLKQHQRACEAQHSSPPDLVSTEDIVASAVPSQGQNTPMPSGSPAPLQSKAPSPEASEPASVLAITKPPDLLDGIEQRASKPDEAQDLLSIPSASNSNQPLQAQPIPNSTVSHIIPPLQPQPPETTQKPSPLSAPLPAPIPAPPQPPSYSHAVMANRTLVMLENFNNSERPTPINSDSPAPTEKISKKDRERDALLRSLLPYTAQQPPTGPAMHNTTGRGRHANTRQPALCEITGKNARYRDPATGLAYSDSYSYKCIRRLVSGGCQWSGLLGAFVGPAVDAARPANGVPEVFIRRSDEQNLTL